MTTRLAKIIATIGPASAAPSMLKALGEAGMDGVRLNGSHGTRAWHAEVIRRVRRLLPEAPILFDIPGRKVRTANMPRPVVFHAGDLVCFAGAGARGPRRIPVNDGTFAARARVGDTIVVADGLLRFVVTAVQGRQVLARAEQDGELGPGKGVHLPFRAHRRPFLSERDKGLIRFAREQGVDLLGLSFVQQPADIEAVRKLLGRSPQGLVAKVETQAALDSLDGLIEAADGLMVDRGDLSAETRLEDVVLFQKLVLARARARACPVIIATEMLESMNQHAVPTKAEVSDVTNAVLDGAAALMLSSETASGRHPLAAVSVMRRIADVVGEAGDGLSGEGREAPPRDDIPGAMARAIQVIARSLPLSKIVAITRSGFAARLIASGGPRQPILAVTDDPLRVRGLNLLRGVRGEHVECPFSKTGLEHVPACLEALWRRGRLEAEDLILVTLVGYPVEGNRMNLMEVHRVGDLIRRFGWK